MWVVLDLMFQAPAAETALDRTTPSGVMSQLLVGVVGHPRLSVGVLAPAYAVVGVMVS